MSFAQAARAQSALDGFDPNADGIVQVVVVQPDGKILIGGEFTSVSPNGGAAVPRNRIARFYPDGTLDTVFNPNCDDIVLTLALQADGKILAGGTFLNMGGQPRNRIARLDATTGAPDSFDPNASNMVRSIAVQRDGKILAGGDFLDIGGQSRARLARLDATTGLADSFDPKPNALVLSIKVQANDQILIGGGFVTLRPNNVTITRNGIARLNPDGTADGAFNPNASAGVFSIAVQADGKILVGGQFTTMSGLARNSMARVDAATGLADSFNPNVGAKVGSIVVQADGKILVGGNFVTIGGLTRQYIARLDPATGLPDPFDPNASSDVVTSIALQPDGKILVGGAFTTFAPNGGAAVPRNRIARLETDGTVDRTLNLTIVGSLVEATAVQPDGKILIGGTFTSVLGVGRNNIARLNSEGTLDTAFNPNANGKVSAMALQPDGKILVGGFFHGPSSIAGQTRNYIARLNANGTLDAGFDPNSASPIHALAVQTDGKILVGGEFIAFFGAITIGGQSRSGIARLNSATGTADSFNPNALGQVFSIAVQADGKILTGGNFTSIGGQPRNRIARLDTDGLADNLFNPNANEIVFAVAVQPDGKILAGGQFSGANSIGGQPRNRIARLDATTGLADSFDPNASAVTSIVYAIAVQADGRILASGTFTNIGGMSRNNIARLNAATGTADSFNPGANGNVASIALLADGKVLIGGQFTNAGGQPRNFFARLANDTAALQNLAVTQDNITWTRGGSSPQFTRVTFESSTDNVSYTPLGNGVAGGNNWTLIGSTFPTTQNLYVRGRGFYRSGYQDGSESTIESIRNLFIPPVLKISITRSANGHVVLECLGAANRINNLQASSDLNPSSFSTINPPPVAADGTGAFTYDDADAVGLTKRFYRLVYP